MTSLLSMTAAVSLAKLKSGLQQPIREQDRLSQLVPVSQTHQTPLAGFIVACLTFAGLTADWCSRFPPVHGCQTQQPHLCRRNRRSTWTGTCTNPGHTKQSADRKQHFNCVMSKRRGLEVNGTDLCGLDDGEVVDAAESGTHRRSESRRAEAHPAAEPRPQLIQMGRRHKSLHLGPRPAVLQPAQEMAIGHHEHAQRPRQRCGLIRCWN